MHQVRNERLEVGNNRINICHKTQAKKALKLFASFLLMQTEKEKPTMTVYCQFFH